MTAPVLPDGLVAVVKRDCPTCTLIAPVLVDLAARPGVSLTVYSQDDPSFPSDVPGVVDDTSLEVSYSLDLVAVPTLLRVVDGVEVARTEGWERGRWEALTGESSLGPELPDFRPGCGSRTTEWGVAEELAVKFGGGVLRSRRVEAASLEDEAELFFSRGWSDGLPVVPPTESRVLAMLAGTSRSPSDVVAVVPPDLAECTVEKVAINAVMAGCKPEYLPVVLAAVEGFCSDEFNGHGVLATTHFVGPVLVVDGPIARAIGMNSGGNCLGQGNRANLTIGRALQLVVRNVGGGRPGGVDRATLGNPGKLSFCFAEEPEGSPFTPLSTSRGLPEGASAVTLFAGEAPRGLVDQLSRTPSSLARSYAGALRTVSHHKHAIGVDAMVVVSPEHGRVFRSAGWDRERLTAELESLLQLDGSSLVRGVDGCAEGLPEGVAGSVVPKFRPGGLLLVHAGGRAGLFSAIIAGWVSGAGGSQPVTVPVSEVA